MIYLQKRIINSRSNSKYRVPKGSVECTRQGIYDVISLPIGSPLIRQLKIVHGFVERKEAQAYNAVMDVRKQKEDVQKKIVSSSKKVTRVKKTTKKAKKKSE